MSNFELIAQKLKAPLLSRDLEKVKEVGLRSNLEAKKLKPQVQLEVFHKVLIEV